MTSRRTIPPPYFLTTALVAAALGACTLLAPEQVNSSPTPAPSSSEASPTTTSARPSNVVLLVAAPTANTALVAQLKQSLTDLSGSSQLSLQTMENVTAEQLATGPRIVVVTGPDALAAADPAGHPQIQFVAVGIPGLKPGPNLSLIGPDGPIPDQLGFLAGYLAALITPDYRVAAVSAGDTPSHVAASLAFLNGATFYCGLCRPTVPPFKTYPATFPITVDAATLQAEGIQTAFVTGDDAATLERLAALGLDLIGNVAPPDAVRAKWIATVVADPDPALREIWQSLLEGQGGRSLPLQPALVDIRSGAVSPGRMRLLADTVAALTLGQIDTAVDPATGQPR